MSQAKDKALMIDLSRYDAKLIYKALKNYTPELVKKPFVKGLYGNCPSCDRVCQFGENYCSSCGQRLMFEVE